MKYQVKDLRELVKGLPGDCWVDLPENKEVILAIENLKMTCRRLSAAKSLETRDKVANMCRHLFTGDVRDILRGSL